MNSNDVEVVKAVNESALNHLTTKSPTHHILYGDIGSRKKTMLYAFLKKKYNIEQPGGYIYSPISISDEVNIPAFRSAVSIEMAAVDLTDPTYLRYIFDLIEDRFNKTDPFYLVIHSAHKMDRISLIQLASWIKREPINTYLILLTRSMAAIPLQLSAYCEIIPLIAPPAACGALTNGEEAVMTIFRSWQIGGIDLDLEIISHEPYRICRFIWDAVEMPDDRLLNLLIDAQTGIARGSSKPSLHWQHLFNEIHLNYQLKSAQTST